MAIKPVELGEKDLRIINVLEFSYTFCPVYSTSHDIKIDHDKLQELISKLEKNLA